MKFNASFLAIAAATSMPDYLQRLHKRINGTAATMSAQTVMWCIARPARAGISRRFAETEIIATHATIGVRVHVTGESGVGIKKLLPECKFLYINLMQGNIREKIMTSLKAIAWVLLAVFVSTLVLSADADARGRRGSHRVGGYNSHGKGSHYIGGR